MQEIKIHIKDSTYEHLKASSITTPEARAALMIELLVDDQIANEAPAIEEGV